MEIQELYRGQRVTDGKRFGKIDSVCDANGLVRIRWDDTRGARRYRPTSPVVADLVRTIWCGGRENGRELSGTTCLLKGNHVAHEV